MNQPFPALCMSLWLGGAGCTLMVENKLEQGPEGSLSATDGSAASAPDDAGRAGEGSRPASSTSGDDGAVQPQADGATPTVPGSDGGVIVPRVPSLDDGGSVTLSDASAPSDLGTPGTAKLCVGVVHACGLMPSGTIECWGNNDEGQLGLRGSSSSSSSTRFTDLTCGDFHTCAIAVDGTISCVGRNRETQRQSPPGNDFVQVTAGKAHSCAIKKDGSVSCWGGMPDGLGVASVPSEPFLAISAGDQVTCGIVRSNGGVKCWGDATSGRTKGTATTDLVAIDLGGAQGCVVSRSGQLECWGEAAEYALTLTEARAVSVGRSGRGCGLLADSVQCWYGNEPMSWTGKFRAIAAGPYATCRLPRDGSQLECFGDEGFQYKQLETLVPKPYPRTDETL